MKTAEIERAFRALADLICDYFFAYRVEMDGTTTCEWVKPQRLVIPRGPAAALPHRDGWLKLIHPDGRARQQHRVQDSNPKRGNVLVARSGASGVG